MATYISMLRGINVSGKNMIRMADLTSLYQSLGFENVTTYLQSGNVVFDSDAPDTAELSARIVAEINRKMGYSIAVLVCTVDYVGELINANPFVSENEDDPTKLLITFLKQPPSEERMNALKVPDGETAQLVWGKQAIFLYCPDGYGQTKLSNTFFERKLAVSATTRNWNTVRALYKMGRER